MQSARPDSLVRARERNWIVLPHDEPDVIRLRPIGSADATKISIHRQLKPDVLRSAT